MKKISLISIICSVMLLIACTNTNSAMFGSTRLDLKYAQIQPTNGYLAYLNYEEGILIGVIRDVMPDANTHLGEWTKAKLAEQRKLRGNPIIKKQIDGIDYYEVIDKEKNFKVIFTFGTNEKNNALQVKFSTFAVDAEPSSLFIKNLHKFKAL